METSPHGAITGRDAIVARVAKLLRLSRSPYPAEAQAALAKAMRLARMHGLELAEAEAAGGETGSITADATPIRRWSEEARLALSLVQEYFSVDILAWKGRCAVWVGRREDIAIAQHVFGYSQEACRRCMRQGRHTTTRKRYSFKCGFFAGLMVALENASLRDPGEEGLVLAGKTARESFIEKHFNIAGTRVHRMDLDACNKASLRDGYECGMRTPLRRPLDNETTTQTARLAAPRMAEGGA